MRYELCTKDNNVGLCFISGVRLPSFNIPKDGLTYLGVEFPKCLKELHPSIVIGSYDNEGNELSEAYNKEFLSTFYRGTTVSFLKNNIANSLSFYRGFRAIVEEVEVKIAHLINIHPLVFPLLCKLHEKTRKTKFIFTIPMPYYGKLKVKDRLTHTIKRFSYSKFDGLCCTSPLLFDWLLRQNFEKDKVFLVPPPIDCSLFKPQNKGECKETLNADHLILFLGDLNPLRFPARKVFKAIKMLEKDKINATLLIISRYANYRPYVDRVAREEEVKDRVRIYTKLIFNNEKKIETYNAADVVIFPFEGFVGIDPPATLLEAMSCGKAVIASRVQSMPQIVKDGVNGILLNKLTPSQLAEALKLALTHKGKRRSIGSNARRTICQQFSKEIVARKLLQMYNHVLATGKEHKA